MRPCGRSAGGWVYCPDCAELFLERGGSALALETGPVYADKPEHCAHCSRPLWDHYPLSPRGCRLVVEMVRTRLSIGTAAGGAWRFHTQGGHYDGKTGEAPLQDWARYVLKRESGDTRDGRVLRWYLYVTRRQEEAGKNQVTEAMA